MTPYSLLLPLLGHIDAETAHGLAIKGLSSGLVQVCAAVRPAHDDPILATQVWGLEFPNPVGMAAGFDKGAQVCDALLALGFGFTEAGTVTPLPQSGNPRPRLFRLMEDEAVINRLGFNSEGIEVVARRLEARTRKGIVGANVGKNKESADASADYETCIRRVARACDYLVVNISSPNTPGLRALQARAQIAELIGRSLEARAQACKGAAGTPPMLVKIAPDLTENQLQDISEVAIASGVDGLIVANTSTERPAMHSVHRDEPGGLSGRPIAALARERLAQVYRLTGGRLPLIGSGGIDSAAEAYARIRAGASLLQFYSAMVFKGPGLANEIKLGLAERLRADGFGSVTQAVGADHRSSAGR